MTELAPASSSRPGYFDTVPDSHAFFPPKLPSSGPSPSTVKATEKFKVVYSHDPILDQNPNELWRFLVSNLRQPRLAVHVSGTHTETHRGRDSETTVTVTDFSFYVDFSKYVVPQWTRIVARPKSKKGELGVPTPTLRETVEYTSSTNPFKELRLEKQVLWEFWRVTQLVMDLVLSTGYGKLHRGEKIMVKFPMQDYKVMALASNQYSQAAHSKVVRVLCVVSCLCVVFWPAWAIARKRMKNRLACEYGMAVSADEFYARNCAWIQSSVVSRRKLEEWIVAL